MAASIQSRGFRLLVKDGYLVPHWATTCELPQHPLTCSCSPTGCCGLATNWVKTGTPSPAMRRLNKGRDQFHDFSTTHDIQFPFSFPALQIPGRERSHSFDLFVASEQLRASTYCSATR